MTGFGYALSSEEHPPLELVRNARRAEEAGFSFALVSDHYHPWVDEQGQSPFVWAVIGGLAHATERLLIGTGVTCPTIRIHPAVIAQAAATCAAMLPGRFFLGVGTGENLNEHILGDKWPAPDEPPPIVVAAAKPLAADVAGRSGDGLVSTAPQSSLVEGYREAGGDGPVYGQVTCCWAASEDEAKETAHRVWPNAAIKGDLSQELPLPLHFEQAAETVTADDVAQSMALGPDPLPYVELAREYAQAGFDHISFHQVGRDQDGFFDFWERELAPALQSELSAAGR